MKQPLTLNEYRFKIQARLKGRTGCLKTFYECIAGINAEKAFNALTVKYEKLTILEMNY